MTEARATWKKMSLDDVLEDWERMRELSDLQMTEEQLDMLADAWFAMDGKKYFHITSREVGDDDSGLAMPGKTAMDLEEVIERFAQRIEPDAVADEIAAAVRKKSIGALDELLDRHPDLHDDWIEFSRDVATVEIAHWLAGHGYRLRIG